jgi:hypothetical protein
LLCASVGKPPPAALVTVITPVPVSIWILATIFDCFSAIARALYSVAAAVTPAKLSDWKASEIRLLGELAAITISEILARAV